VADDVEFADGQDRYVPGLRGGLDAFAHEGRYGWMANTLDLGGQRVLDFGCGVGYGTALLARSALTADGVDISRLAIDYAERHYAAPNVRFHVGDLTRQLPVELVPGSYDMVASSEVLEHVPDVFSYVWNLASMLTPDGVAVVGTPNRLWSHANRPKGRLLAPSHVMEFTPSALANLLALFFDEVHLYFHCIHGIRSDDPSPDDDAVAAPVGRRVVRGLRRATGSFGREVLTPTQYERVKRQFRSHQPATNAVDETLTAEFVPVRDLARSQPDAMGLVAVCRTPTRFAPAFVWR
jgi:SAM-dependent methyltransferase